MTDETLAEIEARALASRHDDWRWGCALNPMEVPEPMQLLLLPDSAGGPAEKFSLYAKDDVLALVAEVERLREQAKYHDEADALRKLRERERDEAREKLEWQAACTKALMESQERLAAEIKTLSAALVLARNVIAANRLVLGEYMGVRDIGEVEKKINAALNGKDK